MLQLRRAQLSILLLVVIFACAGFSTSCVAANSQASLRGTVRSADGNPLEGVTVSAQAKGQTFDTTVYTNHAGQFEFPGLPGGAFQIRVQAVGFDEIIQQRTFTEGQTNQLNFSLHVRRDFETQMSSVEWADSLPGDTAADRRMRNIFVYTCSECHTAGWVLEKRFNSEGWGIIIDAMMNHQTPHGSLTYRILDNYKGELMAYLTRIRGPEPYDWKFKPLPRPKGEETGVVVTEYAITRGNQTEYIQDHNGTDWNEGVPSRYLRQILHDAAPSIDGNVYFTDNRSPERAIGKLDPRTGHVTSFKLLDKDESGHLTHGIVIDKTGNVWATDGTDAGILEFDPTTEMFHRFPTPPAMKVGTSVTDIGIDSKGILWETDSAGALRLDPASGTYTEFKSPTPGGQPYGMTVDSEDNAWFAKFQGDRVGVVDAKSGKIDEVVLPRLDEEIPTQDIEIGKRTGTINGVPAIYQVGPRRLGADRHGTAVWVAEYFAGQLAKIDIHTKKVTEYKIPGGRYSHPYEVAVDKNHMVWISMANTDQIARFDPTTEQFTKFPLPTRGTEARFISVDDSTNPPTVWVSYNASNKIARVQILTKSAPQEAAVK